MARYVHRELAAHLGRTNRDRGFTIALWVLVIMRSWVLVRGLHYHLGMNLANKWLFQVAATGEIHVGSPTDARGLRLRADCGYSHVKIDGSWLQLSVAIRKRSLAERFAAAGGAS